MSEDPKAAAAAAAMVIVAEPLRIIIERLDVRTNDTNERVKQIEKVVLIGNGQPPITVRVGALEAGAATTRWAIGIAVSLATVVSGIVAYAFHLAR